MPTQSKTPIKAPSKTPNKLTQKFPNKTPTKVPEKTPKEAQPAWIEAWRKAVHQNSRRTKLNQPITDHSLKQTFLANREQVKDLWETYTKDRSSISVKTLNSKAATISYLLGFHASNVVRAQGVIQRSGLDHWITNQQKSGSKVRVFDFGCGTGAMSSAIQSLAKPDEFHLYDTNKSLLDTATGILNAMEATLVRSKQGNLAELNLDWFKPKSQSDAHVYVLGYVWNEVLRNKRVLSLFLNLFSYHLTNGHKVTLMILDPGEETLSRALMQLRDDLVQLGFHVTYPCPKTATTCPMLNAKKDWCYSEIAWNRTSLFEWIDSKLEINRNVLATTGFVFSTPDGALVDAKRTKVVVGRPVRTTLPDRYKGFYDLLICDGTDQLKQEIPKSPKATSLRGTVFTK